ncbi:MAG: WD40 repeat domain-containing protein [Muribaculaceae bacterium]|nr:WD40 repeat domain-containing protein [Muribaculaceae bacterium]
MITKRNSFRCLAGALGVFAVMSGSLMMNGETKQYKFNQTASPLEVKPYSCTVFFNDGKSLKTVTGVELFTSNDSLKSIAVNPTGFSAMVITAKKKNKGRDADVYSLTEKDTRFNHFDSKKYGIPYQAAFMPDGRAVAVATDRVLALYDAKKLIGYAQFPELPFVPEIMEVSPNGYYLAVAAGDQIIIYNIEERTVRKTIDAGEKVTDITFSPDSSDFAVLTDDGVLSLYPTRTFDFRKSIDNLGEGLACSYNFDGKYMAVVTSPTSLAVVNLLRDSDREYFSEEAGEVNDVTFIPNSVRETFMAYPATKSLRMIHMPNLKPYYNKLISEELDSRMAEWEKMMPGETMEEYRARVTQESRARQRRLFEDEISTNLAGDLLAGATMSLGAYDRANGVLALNFDSMPTIFLPVPENEVAKFRSVDDLSLSDVQYGILPDDSFEIVYAKVTNNADGKEYIYDNLERATLNYMAAEDAISLEMLQQQQMEEIKLQELREKIVNEAKSMNVISDHTNITVDSRVVPDYDANGKKILNYQVNFTYNVDPQYSAIEDFGPGKYHVDESGAASSMLKIMKEAFEGDFSQYVAAGKKLNIKLGGTADATPIRNGIVYDGAFGEIEDEPVYRNGELSTLSVTTKDGIKENDQLALVRAFGVKDYLERNVRNIDDMNRNYRYEVNVSRDKGSEHRRITVELTFVDVY